MVTQTNTNRLTHAEGNALRERVDILEAAVVRLRGDVTGAPLTMTVLAV